MSIQIVKVVVSSPCDENTKLGIERKMNDIGEVRYLVTRMYQDGQAEQMANFSARQMEHILGRGLNKPLWYRCPSVPTKDVRRIELTNNTSEGVPVLKWTLRDTEEIWITAADFHDAVTLLQPK